MKAVTSVEHLDTICAEARTRYARDDRQALVRFTVACQGAGVVIKQAFGEAAYEVAAFHRLIGSTPGKTVKRLDMTALPFRSVMSAVLRHLRYQRPLEHYLVLAACTPESEVTRPTPILPVNIPH